ncbi:MAG TPA: signal peptidase I [Symbiobacteriaceae bacterium]|nr:signal peptidase I [Symbiobacteriaceae bacterium]
MLKRFWHEWGRDILIGLAIALFFRAQVVEARVVPTESMVPTVQAGDRIFAEKVLYHFTGPRRGDIIVFDPPFDQSSNALLGQLGLEDDYLKRVIGLAGDTVEVKGGQVLVNGKPLKEPYIAAPPAYRYGPVTVPEGKLFVLGDNRNNSFDSHSWGFVEEESVRSRAVLRWWPLNRIGLLK